MKLSELFRTPFKVKGGGVLNLKGFSKRVVDKEVGEGGGKSESGTIDKIIEQWYNAQMTPHSSKFYDKDNERIVNIADINSDVEYCFLYKKSDYTEFSSEDDINTTFVIGRSINRITLYFGSKGHGADIIYETKIDGETYVVLEKQMA